MKKIGVIVGSLLISVILVATIISFITLSGLKGVFKVDNIKEVVANTDIIETTKASAEVNGKEYRIDMTALYAKAETYNIEQKTVNAIINSTAFKNFIGEYISENVNYFLFNGAKPNEGPTRLLIQNIDGGLDAINKEADLNLTKEQKQEIIDALNANTAKIDKLFPDTEQINKALNTNQFFANLFSGIRFITSNTMAFVQIGIMLICINALFFINREHNKWSKWLGGVALLAGFNILMLGLELRVIIRNSISSYQTLRLALYPVLCRSSLSYMWIGLSIIVLGVIILYLGKKNKRAE